MSKSVVHVSLHPDPSEFRVDPMPAHSNSIAVFRIGGHPAQVDVFLTREIATAIVAALADATPCDHEPRIIDIEAGSGSCVHCHRPIVAGSIGWVLA